MTEPKWKDCELVGVGNPKDVVATIGGRTSEPERYCRARSYSPHLRFIVTPKQCDACPFPGLIEVVEVINEYCAMKVKKSRPTAINPGWCSPMTKYGKTLHCLVENVLAAVERLKEKKSEEKHD